MSYVGIASPAESSRTSTRPVVGTSSPGGAPRRRHRLIDPLVVFQIYLVLLVFSPSIYIIAPLGAAGTPASVFGCLIFLLWLVSGLIGQSGRGRATPLHWIVGIFALTMLLGFCAGMLRPITGVESNSAFRGLIVLASGAGVMLFAADSLRTRELVDSLLRFTVLVGSLLALMGIVQFATGISFVDIFHIPGLTANSAVSGLYLRSGYPRVSATAIHSIEFSAVIGVVLPIAAHLAINATRAQWWRWVQLGAMLACLPLTVARSGAISLIVGIAFLLVMARPSQRRILVIAIVASAVAFRFITPGLLGTIRTLFTGAGQDDSISGRTKDFQAIGTYFAEAPWFGRGLGTFIPSIYRTLDNQFLGTLVECGIIGFLGLTLLFIGSMVSAATTWGRAVERFQRTQAASIAAGIAGAFVLAFTFDYFGFPMAFGMLCIVLGASGAIWRIQRDERGVPASKAVRFGRMDIFVALVALVALGVSLVAGTFALRDARSESEARGSLLLIVPKSAGENSFDGSFDIRGTSDLLLFVMESQKVRDSLAAVGAGDYSIALGSGSLAVGTDVLGSGNLVTIEGRGPDERSALRTETLVRTQLVSQLARLQSSKGIPRELKVVADRSFAEPQVFQVSPSRAAGMVAVIASSLLAAGLLMLGISAIREHVRRRRQSR